MECKILFGLLDLFKKVTWQGKYWNGFLEKANLNEWHAARHVNKKTVVSKEILLSFFAEALSPAFIHGAADLWSHPLAYGATAEQQLQLHQQALLHHPALQQQLPVRSFL